MPDVARPSGWGGESMKEMGMTPDQIPLKAGIFGAEAWSEEMRQDIQNTLGIKA